MCWTKRTHVGSYLRISKVALLLRGAAIAEEGEAVGQAD